ncbi:MAG: hypothetical protein CUN54_09370 [Phototrophicales bacterium]|nr:MAG: hypothetical protein CUN54_09370 [Phototrophicales bacterium]
MPNEPINSPSNAFSGFGFPGLASVDFNNGITIPFNAGVPNAGSIAPGFDSVFGFDLDAKGGDVFDMTFARTSGNMNLGVAILSSSNQIVFQASLVTSETLSTRLTFPADDRYTIGVFRIDLLPPDVPEATGFQITGTLNP